MDAARVSPVYSLLNASLSAGTHNFSSSRQADLLGALEGVPLR